MNLDSIPELFVFRPYRITDEDKALKLWEAAFNQQADRKIWRWKFHNCPFGRQSMLCFNRHEEPVAMFAGIPYPANWDGRDIFMTHMIDNMSHPNYRQLRAERKTLFMKNVACYFKTYENSPKLLYIYGFPGIKHFKLGNLMLQYSPIKPGVQYLESEIQNKKELLPSAGEETTILKKPVHRFDQMWEEASPHYPFAVKRNHAFIKWRFYDHPTNDYQLVVLKSPDEKILAYASLLASEDCATIVDIVVKPDRIHLKKILHKIMAICDDQNIKTIRTWLPKQHFLTEMLMADGFNPFPEPLGIIPAQRSFSYNLQYAFTSKSIFYTIGDTDLL